MSTDDGNGDDKTMIMAPSARAGHRQPAPRARLVCENPDNLGSPAGQEILLDGSEITIGRTPDHDVALKADGISRNHAKFFPGDGAWGVEDMGSTNGVLVNGSKAQQAWLKNGDAIILGTVKYRFEFLPEAGAEEEESDAMVEAEKTVVMRPTVKRNIAAEQSTPTPTPTPTKPQATTQAARAPAKPATATPRPAARASAARDKPSGIGSGMKLIIVLAAVVVAAIAFLALG